MSGGQDAGRAARGAGQGDDEQQAERERGLATGGRLDKQQAEWGKGTISRWEVGRAAGGVGRGDEISGGQGE